MLKKVLIIASYFITIVASDSNQHRYFSDLQDNDSLYSQSLKSIASNNDCLDSVVSPKQNLIKKILTQEELEALKEKQQAILASEPSFKEIGTYHTLHGKIAKRMIYDNLKYKKIFLVDFYQKFSDLIRSFIQVAAAEDDVRLSYQDESKVYRALQQNAQSNQIEDYKIIGETPSEFVVDDKVERDPLFNITTGEKLVIDLVCEYIKSNKKEVFEQCVGKGLSEIKSAEVWKPCSCDLQLHKSCFKQCQDNNITSCINSFCMQGKKEKGTLLKKNWDKDFYQTTITQEPKLRFKEIRNADCPVCFESLKPEISAQKSLDQNLPIKKRQRFDKN
ncbi:MAG: hypothetical protein ACXWL5_04390 [Candidatus Chromulinivorax sp.]